MMILAASLLSAAASAASSSAGMTYLRDAEVRDVVHQVAEAQLTQPAKAAHGLLKAVGAKRLAARVRLDSATAELLAAGDERAQRVRYELRDASVRDAAESELILIELRTPHSAAEASVLDSAQTRSDLDSATKDAKADTRRQSAAASPPLPPKWYATLDDASGRTYYWHEDGRTTWTRPAAEPRSAGRRGPAASPVQAEPVAESAQQQEEEPRVGVVANLRANLAAFRKSNEAGSQEKPSLGKTAGLFALLAVAAATAL